MGKMLIILGSCCRSIWTHLELKLKRYTYNNGTKGVDTTPSWLSTPGASILHEAMMHFPLFQISPYFPIIFRLCRKSFFQLHLFPQKRSVLFLQNIWWPFPPTFKIFSSWFRKIYVFLHTLCVFRFPLVLPWCITQYMYWTPLIDSSIICEIHIEINYAIL